jgi:hypothetical protein
MCLDLANDPAAKRKAHAYSRAEELRQAAVHSNFRRHDESQHQGKDAYPRKRLLADASKLSQGHPQHLKLNRASDNYKHHSYMLRDTEIGVRAICHSVFCS